MLLKNRKNNQEYRVRSETYEGGIQIFAVAARTGSKDFMARYHTLEELLNDWEDAD